MQRDRSGTATSAEVQERLEEEAAFARVAAWHAQRRGALASDEPDADADEEDGGDAPIAPPAPAAITPEGRPAKIRARHTGGRVGRRYQLHRGHFAFMRAYVQGLDLGAMWDRYMAIEGASTDMRSVRRGLRQLREDLAAAAQRYAGPYIERCMRAIEVDIDSLAQMTPARLPTLEEFAFERGLDGEREVDQMKAYVEVYGPPDKKQALHALHLKHRLTALMHLERLAARRPHADDPLAAWLRPELTAPLEAVGVVTLRQLARRINDLGYSWAAGLHAVGETKARRIVAWLRMFEDDTGLSIGAHVDQPGEKLAPEVLRAAVLPGTAVVPIDKFIVPPALDGRNGAWRGSRPCMLGVDTDFDALLAYIELKPGLTPAQKAERHKRLVAQNRAPAPDDPLGWLMYLAPTQDSYLLEIYRFMLWAIIAREKATSSITITDAAAYRDFLLDPQPAATWCSGATGRKKYLPGWRPFAGPLSPSAAEKSIKIVSGWYTYLVDGGYQSANPFKGVKSVAAPAVAVPDERSLTLDQWTHISAQLARLPRTSANMRLMIGLPLMYYSGARRAEIIGARVDHLRHVVYPPTVDDPETVEGWELGVVGKGDKQRFVPVPDFLIPQLIDYLASRGLAANLHAPENKPAFLLGQAVDVQRRAPNSPAAQAEVDPLAGITAATWYDQVKRFFKQCAANLASTDPASAAQLERSALHMLRHTHVSHSLQAGTPQHIEREVAGHASLSTTSTYAHTTAKQRLRGTQRFLAQLAPA
jgi:integrase